MEHPGGKIYLKISFNHAQRSLDWHIDMENILTPQALQRKPLSAFKSIFASLQAPPLEQVKGVYRAEFTGPGWLRTIAPPGLGLLGLGGWQGKQFPGDGTGMNLVRRGGELQRRFPVRISEAASLVDGKPCLVIHYTPECPFPWPYVVDELRALAGGSLLGLTMVNVRGLRGLALPFLLHAQEAGDGL